MGDALTMKLLQKAEQEGVAQQLEDPEQLPSHTAEAELDLEGGRIETEEIIAEGEALDQGEFNQAATAKSVESNVELQVSESPVPIAPGVGGALLMEKIGGALN